MSASTPAVRGGLTNQQLGGALAAVVIAIVVVGGLIGLQAAATRKEAAPALGPIATSPYAVAGDHGWVADGSSVAAPSFIELPRPFEPSTISGGSAPSFIELPRPFEPSTTSVGGGRGTRLPR